MSDDELRSLLERVKSNIRITKVVATRSVKGKTGDNFAGFSSAWDSVQEDGAQGLEGLVPESNITTQGMTMLEGKIAHYVLSMQADIAAHEAAMASGGITIDYCMSACKAIKTNYAKLIRNAVGNTPVAVEGAK